MANGPLITTPGITNEKPAGDEFGLVNRPILNPFLPLSLQEIFPVAFVQSVFSPPGVASAEGPFVIVAENSLRAGLYLTNDSPTSTMYLGFGAQPVSPTSFSLILPPGALYVMPWPAFGGEVQAFWTDPGTVSVLLQITEMFFIITES